MRLAFILISFKISEIRRLKLSSEYQQQWQKIKGSRDQKLNRFLLIKDERLT